MIATVHACGARQPREHADRRAARLGLRLEDLQPSDVASGRRDRAEARIQRVAGALGEARVAVAGDRAQENRDPALVALAAARDVREEGRRIDVGEIEPPGDESSDGVLGRGRRGRVAVRPEERDAHGPGVEAQRVRADHVPVDSSEAALVDRAEAVDEKVVADVVPAVSLHVEELDPLHDRGRLRPRVVVPAGRVVHDREAHVGGVARRPAPDRLVRSPRERGTIGGAAVAAGTLSGMRISGLHTRCARTRVTRPTARAWMAFDVPTHHGLPILQPGSRRSGEPTSGPSSSSGAPGRQALQRPPVARVRNSTFPRPRQGTPASVKRETAAGVPNELRARPSGARPSSRAQRSSRRRTVRRRARRGWGRREGRCGARGFQGGSRDPSAARASTLR